MSDNKFLKAQCKKTGRWYGLEIRKTGPKWKVVNLIDLSESEAAVLTSEIEQDYLETDSNLLACKTCGNRVVGGCNCSRKSHSCEKNMDYQFDCIYCDNLELDYGIPTYSDVKGIIGETIRLSQGQEVRIQSNGDRPLKKIFVGVGWDPLYTSDFSIDIDSSVIVMSSKRNDRELVFFGNLEHGSGCVIHHGDNLTGENLWCSNEDDENIFVDLDKVPDNRDSLVFVLNVFCGEDRNQSFGVVKNLYIKLYDPESKKVLVEYRVTGNFERDTGLIIGKAYRKDKEWFFKAIGKGVRVSDIHQLEEMCVRGCGRFGEY